MRITEPSNDDYDNDVSDNCDHNFATFDDFGVKKVSHNMILMSKYMGQHGGKKVKKNPASVSHPPFRAMPKRKHFFSQESFPNFPNLCVKSSLIDGKETRKSTSYPNLVRFSNDYIVWVGELD